MLNKIKFSSLHKIFAKDEASSLISWNNFFYLLQIVFNTLSGYLLVKYLAYYFGISDILAGFWIAYSIPAIFVSVMGSKYLYGSLGTLFARYKLKYPSKVNDVFSFFLSLSLITGIIFLGLGLLFKNQIIAILGPGLSVASKELAYKLFPWMLVLSSVNQLGIYFGSVFTAYKVPVAPSFVFTVARVGAIASMYFSNDQSLLNLSILLSMFGLLGVLCDLVFIYTKTNIRYHPVKLFSSLELNTFWKGTSSLLIIPLISQLSASYINRLATVVGSWAIGALSYSAAFQTIGTIIGKVLAFIMGADFVEYYENGDYKKATNLFNRYILWTILISIVIVLIVQMNIALLINILLGGGEFGSHEIIQTVNFSKAIIWSIPGISIIWVLIFPIFNKQNNSSIMVIFLVGDFLKILVNIILFDYFDWRVLAWSIPLADSVRALIGIFYIYRYVLKESQEC